MFIDEETEGQRDKRQTQLGLAPEGRPGLKPRCPRSQCGSSILCETLRKRRVPVTEVGTSWLSLQTPSGSSLGHTHPV